MAQFCGGVLALAMMVHLLQGVAGQCQSGSFNGCECNIMGACDAQGKPLPNLDFKLTDYSPVGLEQFGRFVHNKQNLAYLCENAAVTILYDCGNRTPLYAATVMNKQQLNARYVRPKITFRSSSTSLNRRFQQKMNDYKRSKVKICYKTTPKKDSLIDPKWYKALNQGKAILPLKGCNTNSGNNDKLHTDIHRGHLIAAAYGRGVQVRIKATFT